MRKRGARFARRVDNPLARLAEVRAQQRLASVLQKDIPEQHLIDLELAWRGAFEQIRLGAGGAHEYAAMAAVTEMAIVLAQRGIGAEQLPQLAAGQQALARAADRGMRLQPGGKPGDRLAFDAPGLIELRDALDVHAAQLLIATRAEFIEAWKESLRRARTWRPAEIEASA